MSQRDSTLDSNEGTPQVMSCAEQVDFIQDPTDGQLLVTVPDAAKLMHCGVRTVHGWVARGLVEVRRTPTGQARVVVASLWKRSAA